MRANFHTLCLLDIKVKEQSFENMAKGIKLYEQPRYMSVTTCIEQLLEIEDKIGEGVYSRATKAFGLARVGQSSQQIVSGTLGELLDSPGVDFGAPLHSLVLAAPELHDVEEAMYEYWHWDRVGRGAKRKAERQEREKKEKEEEREREQKQKEIEAAQPTQQIRSTIPKQRTPVKASASAAKPAASESSDDEEFVVMEPIC